MRSEQQAKRATALALMLVLVASVAADDYVIPGARPTTNGAAAAIQSAVATGTNSATGAVTYVPRVVLSDTTGAVGAATTLAVGLVSTSGSFAAGAKWIDLRFSPNFAGTVVATGTLTYSGSTDAADRYEAPFGATLPVVSYTVSTGTFGFKSLR